MPTSQKNLVKSLIEKQKGFILSKVIMAAFDLDLFLLVEKDKLTKQQLSERLQLNPEMADAFIEMLISGDVLKIKSGFVMLCKESQEAVCNIASLKAWNDELEVLYKSMENYSKLLRKGAGENNAYKEFWGFKDPKKLSDSQATAYSRLMDETQENITKHTLRAFDFSPYEKIVDMGGGHGKFATMLAQKVASPQITVVDLPQVCAGCYEKIKVEKLESRIQCLGVDFFTDDLPEDADLVTFNRVLHDWSDEKARKLLARAAGMIKKKRGKLLIIEAMHRADNLDVGAAAAGVMVSMLGGKRRSTEDFFGLLKGLSFKDVGVIDMNFGLYRIVYAQ